MAAEIKLVWLYPDILNLHGDRGNIMAWQHVADKLRLALEIQRVDNLEQPLLLEDADIVFLCPGEIKNMPKVIATLQENSGQLENFITRGGYLFAIGNSGCILAEQTIRTDGSEFAGLGLLPMRCRERAQVYGDDLWLRLSDSMELIGNQIQVVDSILAEKAKPFAEVLYGHGNNNSADEGCRRGNIIFTNTLGPLLVKNPRFAAAVLSDIAERKNIGFAPQLSSEDTEYEDKSFALIKRFIEKKMA